MGKYPTELSKWTVHHSVFTYRSQFLGVEELESSTDTKERSTFFRIHLPDWVNVVAASADGEIILIRQYRHGAQVETLEIPGGVVDEGEDPLRAARRELQEETGYGGGQWQSLGYVYPNPAIQTNRCHLFAATGVTIVSDTSFDKDEEIILCPLPVSQLATTIATGKISNAIVLSALLMARAQGLLPPL